jgi:multidrug transporter EmrE-like cation transporter
MKMIFAMFPTIILVVYGQLVTKWRIEILANAMEGAPDPMARLLTYLKDPYIVSSYIAALVGSAAWMFVVERYAISIAFPIYVGLTVFAVAIGGCFFFGEPMNMSRSIAILFIVVGVAIGANS